LWEEVYVGQRECSARMQFPTGPTARRRRPCSRGSSQTGLQVLMASAHHGPMEAKRWPGSCRPIVMAAAARPTRANIKNTKQISSLEFRRAGAKRPLVAAAYFRSCFGKFPAARRQKILMHAFVRCFPRRLGTTIFLQIRKHNEGSACLRFRTTLPIMQASPTPNGQCEVSESGEKGLGCLATLVQANNRD